MDYLEGLFRKLTSTHKQRAEKSDSACFFSEVENYIQCIVDLLFASDEKISAVPSLNTCGFIGGVIYLPQWVNLFDEIENNKKVYLWLLLSIYGGSKVIPANCLVKSGQPKSGQPSNFMRTQFLLQIHLVNNYLRQEFNSFEILQNLIFNRIRIKSSIAEKKHSLYEAWVNQFKSCEPPGKEVVSIVKNFRYKKNEKTPMFMQYSIPQMSSLSVLHDSPAANQKMPEPKNENTDSSNSEVENPAFSPPEQVSIEDKKAEYNPVMHSFEKIETLDEYQGGYRPVDGDNELENHQKALEEVDLSHVTIDGDAAQSVFKTNKWVFFDFRKAEMTEAHELYPKVIKYPEWNAHKKLMMPDFCSVYERELKEPCVLGEEDVQFLMIDKKFVHIWKSKVSHIFNEPLWIKRQRQGEEVDIDEFIRLKCAIRSGNTSLDEAIFAKKAELQRSLDLTLLIDQSMSTDSYLDGLHIIEVMREALVTVAEIFDTVLPNIEVSSFWSATRAHCEYTILKSSQQAWSTLKANLLKMKPRGYTRLGPAIRHASARIDKGVGKRKLLFLVTDGKPTDLDGYEGRQGLEDVRMAILEAEQKGIYVFCLAIDRGSQSYFRSMFKHYQCIQGPRQLCEELLKQLVLGVQ